MNKGQRTLLSFTTSLFFILASCSSPQTQQEETPTGGTLRILTDESFYPLIKAEINTFQAIYDKAKIEIVCMPESEAVREFLSQNADLIVTGRELNEAEKKIFSSQGLTLNTSALAKDALALVVNKDFPFAEISVKMLKEVLSGKIRNWEEVSKDLQGEIILVTDQSNSSNLNSIYSFCGMDPDSVKIYAAGSNARAIEYIASRKHAIGLVGYNLLSDMDHPSVKNLAASVQILGIKDDKDSSGTIYYPFQSDLAEGIYPLSRNIYIIANKSRTGLHTGLASFMLSEKGQRIVLKAGLLPARTPGREVVFK